VKVELRSRKKSRVTKMEGEELKKFSEDLSRGMGQAIANSLRQVSVQNMDTFTEILREENVARREELDTITKRFEDMQISQDRARETARMSSNQPLPKLANCDDFDEWREHVQQQCRANHWTDHGRVIEMIPSALNGNARRAFHLLQPDQKRDLDTMFEQLRLQLNPQSDANNRRRFLRAEKQPGESMSDYINRERTYLSRFSENIVLDPLAREILKEKVFSNLKPNDRKMLRTAVDKDCSLDVLVQKADMLLNEASEAVIGVIENKERENVDKFANRGRRSNRGGLRGGFGRSWGHEPYPQQWNPWQPQAQWGDWGRPMWGGYDGWNHPRGGPPPRGRGIMRGGVETRKVNFGRGHGTTNPKN
jgi:hypothetical protein